MSVVAIVVVSLAVVLLIAGVVVLRRVTGSPKQRYRRELRGIRRIRRGNRAGDPDSTSIGVNFDAFYGSS